MTEADSPGTAVVGVGNPIMGDDGVGERVVEALHERGVPDGVAATHAGTTAFLALEAMDGTDRAVVVDAVETGEAAPGTVHRYRYRDGAFEGVTPEVTMHDFTFADALQAGRHAYDTPEEVVVIGVEPASTEVGVGLSDPVAGSVPAVVDVVLEELHADEHPTDSRSAHP